MKKSIIHGKISGAKASRLVDFNAENYQDLYRLGINLDAHNLGKMSTIMSAQDELQSTVTTASIPNPIQFLQHWLPGFVYVATAARKIDELIGLTIAGDWYDEQIVQGLMELTGRALPYGDYANVPFSSWNVNFAARTIVRFEEGLRVGRLEQGRADRVNIDSAREKREAAAQALDIARNDIGFYGFNNGANATYGFLNDPQLPAYTQVVAGASTNTEWSTKTFLEITKDIRTAIAELRTNSQDVVDPENTPMTLGVATAAVDYLSVTSDFGISVRDWLKQAYPLIRVVSAPELNNANAGDNVFYLYADKVNDSSTDGGETWAQLVASRVFLLGVHNFTKGYEEDYSMATAGALLKRPYAVVRYYGI